MSAELALIRPESPGEEASGPSLQGASARGPEEGPRNISGPSSEPGEQLDLLAARTRDAGIAAALEDPAGRDWADLAVAVIEHLASTGVEFGAEEVRRRVGDPPTPNVMGAAFRSAATRRVIQPVGFRRSRRLQRQGGLERVWVGRLAGP